MTNQSLEDIKDVYKEFITLGADQLKQIQNDANMEDEFFAQAVSSVIVGAMTTSVQAVKVLKDIETLDIENGIKGLQSAKDLMLKEKQIATETQRVSSMQTEDSLNVSRKALVDQQKSSEVHRTAQELYKLNTLLVDEHNSNLKKDALTEAQESLAIRQTSGFDDKLRISKAEHASGLVGMIYASGNDVPTDAWTYAKAKVDSI